ncbi:hypothetical protein CHS0354_027446 [Potamilus streckersoni]|uniref:Uncharacterized protein n=1 Tax=Potamilus streckersoni TaxID=2493646 RepID=A0AAE0W8R8_9BIVA|nr:hypothetical protein CHS0354_027446 [Potamilus streckersoni]
MIDQRIFDRAMQPSQGIPDKDISTDKNTNNSSSKRQYRGKNTLPCNNFETRSTMDKANGILTLMTEWPHTWLILVETVNRTVLPFIVNPCNVTKK